MFDTVQLIRESKVEATDEILAILQRTRSEYHDRNYAVAGLDRAISDVQNYHSQQQHLVDCMPKVSKGTSNWKRLVR